MLGQLAHVFSLNGLVLNGLVDLSTIFAGELRRMRGIEAVKPTAFPHANRTRNPAVMQKLFRLVHGMSAREDPAFANPRHRGALAKFRMRGICAVDSTTIRLAYWCIKWAKRRQRKAAVKRVAGKVLPKGTISGETIRLAGVTTKADYPKTLRRIKALVEAKGEMREMVFHTNNFEWSASTVAGPCKARWAVELLFRELKQTLRLQSFFGESQNAVEWQIWAAMLTHLVLRHIKWKNDVSSSYTRFAAIIKNTTWLKRSLEAVIKKNTTGREGFSPSRPALPFSSPDFSRQIS